MRNRLRHPLSSVIVAFCLLGPFASTAAEWHNSLSLGNGDYWRTRVAVTLSNASEQAAAGVPMELSIPALAGTQAECLRVCRTDGVELLYDIRDKSGAARHRGSLEASDKLLIPVECSVRESATIFVYAENPAAWPVVDFFVPADTNIGPHLHATIGKVESLRLTQTSATPQKVPSGNWGEVRVRNVGDKPLTSALVRLNLRSALARLPGLPLGATARVLASDGSSVGPYALGDSADLLFPVQLLPRTEQRFLIEFTGAATASTPDPLTEYGRLMRSSANLVSNASFENGREEPEGWSKSGSAGQTHPDRTGFSDEARFGVRSLETRVADNPSGAWIGWTSRDIPVRPGATYLLSGWLKAAGLQSSAGIHAHFHTAKGALTQSGAMASTQPGASGNSDWVKTQAVLQAPPDAASIQLHLTMNTAGILRHDGIVLCEVIDGHIERVHSAAEQTDRAALQVWQVNPLVKVFPDTPAQRPAQAVSIELGRNEFEPFQLALRHQLGTTNPLEVSVSALRNEVNATLPPVKIERVGFVPVDYPSAYYSTAVPDWCRKVPRGAGATDGWAGWWPDPLAPGGAFELAHGQTQPLWFTVRAPKEAAPGDYHGEIVVASGGQRLYVLPLTVHLLPFTLPQTTQLHAIFDFRFGPGNTLGTAAESAEQRRRWLQFMAEHRLGIDAIHPEPKFSYQDGKVTMDAREFDQQAHICFDELGMSACYTPQFFYMFGWAYPPKKFFGLEPFTPQWTAAFKQAYQLFTDHVREKGWHDKFVYYISDEPHYQQDFVVQQMKKLCALIHEVDSSIPIYSSTWRHCAAWDESLDLWGIGQYGCFPLNEMTPLRKAGKQFWFTCDGQMATDTPYLATERMLPYYCFKYGVQGFEFWGLNWWTYNPWQTGWHQFIRQSDEGKKYYWIRYPNGDGFLTYPGKAVGIDGPASTIRLEQVREGLEDYEAMQLLAATLDQARQTGERPSAAERALEMARDLVTIPNAGGLRSSEILPDPDRILAIRHAVNAALVELSK